MNRKKSRNQQKFVIQATSLNENGTVVKVVVEDETNNRWSTFNRDDRKTLIEDKLDVMALLDSDSEGEQSEAGDPNVLPQSMDLEDDFVQLCGGAVDSEKVETVDENDEIAVIRVRIPNEELRKSSLFSWGSKETHNTKASTSRSQEAHEAGLFVEEMRRQLLLNDRLNEAVDEEEEEEERFALKEANSQSSGARPVWTRFWAHNEDDNNEEGEEDEEDCGRDSEDPFYQGCAKEIEERLKLQLGRSPDETERRFEMEQAQIFRDFQMCQKDEFMDDLSTATSQNIVEQQCFDRYSFVDHRGRTQLLVEKSPGDIISLDKAEKEKLFECLEALEVAEVSGSTCSSDENYNEDFRPPSESIRICQPGDKMRSLNSGTPKWCGTAVNEVSNQRKKSSQNMSSLSQKNHKKSLKESQRLKRNGKKILPAS